MVIIPGMSALTPALAADVERALALHECPPPDPG